MSNLVGSRGSSWLCTRPAKVSAPMKPVFSGSSCCGGGVEGGPTPSHRAEPGWLGRLDFCASQCLFARTILFPGPGRARCLVRLLYHLIFTLSVLEGGGPKGEDLEPRTTTLPTQLSVENQCSQTLG